MVMMSWQKTTELTFTKAQFHYQCERARRFISSFTRSALCSFSSARFIHDALLRTVPNGAVYPGRVWEVILFVLLLLLLLLLTVVTWL